MELSLSPPHLGRLGDGLGREKAQLGRQARGPRRAARGEGGPGKAVGVGGLRAGELGLALSWPTRGRRRSQRMQVAGLGAARVPGSQGAAALVLPATKNDGTTTGCEARSSGTDSRQWAADMGEEELGLGVGSGRSIDRGYKRQQQVRPATLEEGVDSRHRRRFGMRRRRTDPAGPQRRWPQAGAAVADPRRSGRQGTWRGGEGMEQRRARRRGGLAQAGDGANKEGGRL